MARRVRFAESVRSQPGLAGAFLIDAIGTGMFIPFSLLFFQATTSLTLTRIGLALSVAALVRIPVTIAAGPLSDRFGPRAAIVGSQLLQAAGFVGYLFVHGFWQLVAAAVLVQIGNSIFWVAYAPLIFTVAAEDEREHWFALGTSLRTAGYAAGSVIAGATVALGGRDGYIGVVAANGASFVLAAFLSARLRPGTAAPPRQDAGSGTGSGGSWRPLLRDHAFLGFVTVNVGITFLALAVPTALPVFLVDILRLPKWSPGAALALNATLVALSAPIVMSAISGRRRRNVLMASQACMIVAFAVLLLVHLLPAGAAITLVLIAVLPLAACEVVQGAVVPAVVTESATPLTLGRYTSAYQVTFSIADIICPGIVTVALHVGAAALWLPLSAVALLDLVAVGLLARRMTALTWHVGQALPEFASPAERPLEADGVLSRLHPPNPVRVTGPVHQDEYGCSGPRRDVHANFVRMPPSSMPCPSRAMRRRDRLYRLVTRLFSVALLPLAFVVAPRRARHVACQWALAARFPAENLDGLTPATRAAFEAARTNALWRHGELIGLTAGYRDAGAQARLFADAVRQAGSPGLARTWTLPPQESRHVTGTALDIRPVEGARWLERHGSRHHLYRVYDNEWWHFEYRPDGRPPRLPHPGVPITPGPRAVRQDAG